MEEALTHGQFLKINISPKLFIDKVAGWMGSPLLPIREPNHLYLEEMEEEDLSNMFYLKEQDSMVFLASTINMLEVLDSTTANLKKLFFKRLLNLETQTWVKLSRGKHH